MATVDDKKIIFSMVGVSKIIPQNQKQILKNIYLSFFYGAKIGIIGLNGAGKSTLMKIIAGLVEPTQGEVVWSPGYSVGYLPQDPPLDETKTVKENVMEGVQQIYDALKEYDDINVKFGQEEYYSDADKMDKLMQRQAELQDIIDATDAWNIDSRLERAMDALRCPKGDLPVTNLSGGERRRVALCRLLLQKPDVLLLDEPTNDLDLETVEWLEDYLGEIDEHQTVLVVSHDCHFLDSVSTQTIDIDFGKVTVFAGNYSFWYESSQLALRQAQNQKMKAEEKKKQLEEFIRRFSANVAKSKQTTSRKKMLERLNVEEIRPSSRKYPGIIFSMEREPGNQILEVENLKAVDEDGTVLFDNVNFNIEKGQKVVFLSCNSKAMTALFEIINGNREPDAGTYNWGVTITTAYLPLDNTEFFDCDLNLVDWLSQFGPGNEVAMKGFLGRMLFKQEEVEKKVNVLSGGEKMRCMIARMQLQNANCLILDTPTNHLDLESIQAFNNNLTLFKGNILFSSHDHEFIETVADRIIELTPNGAIDKLMPYDEYIHDETIKEQKAKMYC
mgnify:CR=1 FL=1